MRVSSETKLTRGRGMEEDNGEFQNVVKLGFDSFFTDVSSEIVFSILPAFILGLPGEAVATLGLIEGLAESLSTF